MPTKHVYQVWFFAKDDKRPWIDGRLPENGNIPWLRITEIIEGRLASKEYEPVHLRVPKKGADLWDTYPLSGTYGLISKRAADVLGPYMKQCFGFLEATINKQPYCLLRSVGSLDCLDRKKSVIVPDPEIPGLAGEIKQYRFFKNRIPDPIVFQIPEFPALYATDTIKELVGKAKLRGVYFFDTEIDPATWF